VSSNRFEVRGLEAGRVSSRLPPVIPRPGFSFVLIEKAFSRLTEEIDILVVKWSVANNEARLDPFLSSSFPTLL